MNLEIYCQRNPIFVAGLWHCETKLLRFHKMKLPIIEFLMPKPGRVLLLGEYADIFERQVYPSYLHAIHFIFREVWHYFYLSRFLSCFAVESES